MNITSRPVNESHIDEIAALVQSGSFIINLDHYDVAQTLKGRKGTLYLATKDSDTPTDSFLSDVFSHLIHQDPIRHATRLLLSIGLTPDEPLMMDDMSIIHDFFEELPSKDVESKWGIKTNPIGKPMTILVLCTR